jgi:hypothetical protein
MKRAYRAFAILTVCTIAAMTGAMLFAHAGGNLVQRSRPLVSVKGWWTEDTLDRPYTWLSETSLFSHSGWWRLSKPFTYDTSTHMKTPLTKLQNLLGSDGDDETDFWELSPDRRHIAWNIECYDTVHTATLDGREYKVWDIEGPGYGNTICGLSWLADGHRWIASTCDHGSAAGGLDCIASINDRSSRLDGVPATSAESILFAQPVTRVDDGVFEVQQAHAGGVKESDFRELGAPANGSIAEVEASPDRKHLAWLCCEERISTIDRIFHRINHGYSMKVRRYNSLRISSIDGSNLLEVGRIEASGDDDVNFLQWMPNGKRVTYVYHNEIYAIDVGGWL